LCVDRFVPKEWTGIQSFPPLDLQVKENFPPFHKVRSRPINPGLYEHAKKEFERLTGYVLQVLNLAVGITTCICAQGQALHSILRIIGG